MITKNATQLNRKANACKVVMYNPNGVYRIKSPSGNIYTVDLGLGGTCTCEWGERGGAGCAHELCARKDWARRHEGRAVSFQAGDPDAVARKQHKATAPIAAQSGDAVTMVLRDRVDEVAELDAEIELLGTRLAEARFRWNASMDWNVKAQARDEMARLRETLIGKQRERARASVKRMRERRAA